MFSGSGGLFLQQPPLLVPNSSVINAPLKDTPNMSQQFTSSQNHPQMERRQITDESSDPSGEHEVSSLGRARGAGRRSDGPVVQVRGLETDGESRIEENSEEEEDEERRPLHEEINSDDEFEVTLTWHRNKRVLLRRLEEIFPRGRLSLVNLSRRGLGVSEAPLVGEAIACNPSLCVLKLSYNEMGDEGASIIAQSFSRGGRHHPKLSIVDFGFNGIGNRGCEQLALHVLAGNLNIRKVYLSGNRIRGKGALAIAGAILHGSGLSSIHLSANNIGSRGLKAIAGAIAKQDSRALQALGTPGQENFNFPTVKELFVDSCGVDALGFLAIPGMLLSNRSLDTLSVSNMGIDDQSMVLLSQALAQNRNIPLRRLDLSFNSVSDQGVETLMNAVWASPFLRELKLDNNKLQDRGAQLCAVVLTSIDLVLLDISFNRISTVGMKALMKNVAENNSLERLGLSGIPVDQNSSKALAYGLAYNCSLKAINLDNCTAGYAAQRHIVAGIVSNQGGALRAMTGFPITPIATTLGMPRLPESWSNEQLLGFVRLMWQQWLLKSGQGHAVPNIRGPAPPAAVAAASKIAFTSLGTQASSLFRTEAHERPITEGAPVDPANASLLERTESGTLIIPSFSSDVAGDLAEWVDRDVTETGLLDSGVALAVSHLDDPDRRNKNLKWLRIHFRSLSEVARLPFHSADLWQLHQFYFSPPVEEDETGGGSAASASHSSAPSSVSGPGGVPLGQNVTASSLSHQVQVSGHTDRSADHTTGSSIAPSSLGRAVSFSSLSTAGAISGLLANSHKRRPAQAETTDVWGSPVAKRAKSVKSRIACYPRIMAKIQSLGSKPMDHTLSMLRQLKYTENVFFNGTDPYEECKENESTRLDIEMILLDLL